MKKIYKARRECLRICLKKEFTDKVRILGDSTGLHLVVEIRGIDFLNNRLIEIIKQHKVKIYPVELHTIQKGIHKDKIILGYGNLSKEEIKEGIRRLKYALTLYEVKTNKGYPPRTKSLCEFLTLIVF